MEGARVEFDESFDERKGKPRAERVTGGTQGEDRGPPAPQEPNQPTGAPPKPAEQRVWAHLGADLFLGTGTSCALFSGDREDRQVQTYYLPAPRPSSPALFQRVCLAWD